MKSLELIECKVDGPTLALFADNRIKLTNLVLVENKYFGYENSLIPQPFNWVTNLACDNGFLSANKASDTNIWKDLMVFFPKCTNIRYFIGKTKNSYLSSIQFNHNISSFAEFVQGKYLKIKKLQKISV